MLLQTLQVSDLQQFNASSLRLLSIPMLFYVDAEVLQILFGGTLTEITCSAAVPVFRLVKQEMVYDPEDYVQLPELFDIEASLRASPTRNNVTLYINGTNCSNNVTVMCRNISNVFSGQFQVLFTLMLEFEGKFIN